MGCNSTSFPLRVKIIWSCTAVSLVLGALIFGSLLGVGALASSRFYMAYLGVGFGAVLAWAAAVWFGREGIGMSSWLGFVPYVLIVETGLAGYFGTTSLWRFSFAAFGLYGGLKALIHAIYIARTIQLNRSKRHEKPRSE
jgi:hypothetical protein